MKLRLPLKLLSALLSFYAISGFHVFAATEWDGSRYSGNIYTWVGSSSNDFHNGGIVLTNPDGTYGPVNTNWGSVSEEGSIWNLFANETGLSEYNTLRFVASGTEVGDVTVSATNKNPSCSFTPFTMGGLIVEEGASGFSLVPNNNAQRTLILGRAGTEEPVLFTVREDFSLGSSSNAWGPVNVNADWNVLVANGKTLNVYGALNSSGRTITVGGEGFSGTLVLNNAANASMTAEWVITSGSTVRCMNNSALGSGLVTLDGGTLDFNSQTIGSTITLNMSGTGTLQNVTVDGAILSYTSSSGNDGITASNTTWTSGKIDIGRLLQGFSAEGSNTVDLGAELGEGFSVLGLDTGQYRIEGSVLTIEDGAISRVTWVSAGAGGALEETVKNAFTLALGEGSAANVSLGYLNGTLTTSGDKVYQITNTGGTKINLNGVYNRGETLPSGNLNYRGDIWMDISGGAFGIISGGVTNEWSTKLQTSTLTGDTHVQLSGNATAEHVIGGNNKGASTTLTGNTNVTVKDNAIVAGAIIGGSTSAHNAVTTITGNTSVLVTNVQYSNTAQNLDGGLSNSYIIGGSSWSSNTTSGTTIQGSTSATINLNGITLSGTEEHNSFVKTIIGGSYGNVNNAGTVNNINGDTSVSIIGREGITFTGDIIGGSFENSGQAQYTIGGNSSISISGGSTFTGNIYGGSYSKVPGNTGSTMTTAGNITVELGTGTYRGNIYGAGNKGTAGGDVLVSLTGGSVFGAEGQDGGITVGGSAGAAVEGNRTLELKGTFGNGDFQNVTFTRFDEINIAQEGSSATIWALTDSPSLTKTGAGTLTLGADAAGAETILDGTTEGITITEGSLNLSGAGGSHMKGTWNIASGSRLTGVSGTVTVGGENGLDSLSIALGTENIGQDTQASGAVISNGSGTGSDPNLSIEGEGLTLDLSNDAVVNLLLDHKTDDSSSYLTLTSGTLTVGNLGDIAFTTDLLSNYGIRVTGTDGGSLVLSGAATGLYRVQEEGGNAHEVNSYQTLSGYAGVVIGGGQTLTVNLAGAPGEADGQGAKINNLIGAAGSSLAVNNTGDGTAVVILNNKQMTTGEDDIDPAGQDTVMGGSITGGSNVAFIKEGTGTLTVGGTMDVETLAMREGNIVLNGASNTLDTLTLEGGGLTINGNAEVGTITGTEAGGTLAIQGTFDLTGTSNINDGAITGTGSLRIREGAELALGGEARLDGISVTADGTLTLTGTESGTISSLSGSGALSMNGGRLSISSATTSSGTFSGTLAGSGTLDISGQATQYLQTGNKDYDLAVRDGGVLVLKGTAHLKASRPCRQGLPRHMVVPWAQLDHMPSAQTVPAVQIRIPCRAAVGDEIGAQ